MIEAENAALRARRIMVALDTSARGQAALEAAIRLALNTSAELQGMFVEDEDLVRLAALPFAREVDFASASTHQLRAASMERALRAAAEEAQQAFARTLRQFNLRWTFRVLRGRIAEASLAAAGDVDLLVIGQQGRSLRVIARDSLPQRPLEENRIVAVFDGSPSAYRSLELASSLDPSNAPPLSVLVLADDCDDAAQQCMSWLQQRNVAAEVNRIDNPSADAILEFVRQWPPKMLLINRDSKFISQTQIYRLVDESDCPLILC